MDTLYGIDPAKMVELNRTATLSTSSPYVILDVAEMMRAYAEGMQRAFQMGWETRLHDESMAGSSSEAIIEDQLYYGIYDDVSYGVYQNKRKLEASRRFWHKDSLQWQRFLDYDEALAYACKGVAERKAVSVDLLPPMQYPVDWRQMV